jgi:hypothetical protein
VTSLSSLTHARTSAARAPMLWGLSGVPERSARRLEQWLDSLADLTVDEWIDIAHHSSIRDARDLASACARVDRAIVAHELEVTAWFIRDLVETAVQPGRSPTLRRSRHARSQLAVARSAAEWAALALAMEHWLAPSDRALLWAPFAEAGAGTQVADSDPVVSSALGPGSRSSSSVAIAGTRRTKTLPPPSRS